jgi:hypothetical protein
MRIDNKARRGNTLGNGDLGVSLIHHHVWRQTGVAIRDCCMGRRLLGASRYTWENLPSVLWDVQPTISSNLTMSPFVSMTNYSLYISVEIE